jgi:hypothetical protein
MTETGGLSLRPTAIGDVGAITELYRRVARVPGGIARLEHEVSEAYVSEFIDAALARGVGYVADTGEAIVGEIHAYAPGVFCFEREGRFRRRIRNVDDSLEAEVPMAWLRLDG